MVIKDGVKYACQSCLKGHRVSGCTHTDRDLIVVPKKGRPITQCQHCRSERKKRSAHVSCACGTKPASSKEKCVHLREAEAAKVENGALGLLDELVEHPDDGSGCCCHHGGKCSCAAFKREPADDECISPPPNKPAVHCRGKPRLESTKSEGHLTVFSNGHHPPVHRKNHAAHQCGMPYKIPTPKSHSVHGIQKAAHRSVDSLSLESSQTTATPKLGLLTGQLFGTERRLSRSENGSPHLLTPQTFSGADAFEMGPTTSGPYSPAQAMQRMPSDSSQNFQFGASDSKWDPTSGLADGSYDPWSAMASADSFTMPNNNPFSAWPTVMDPSLARPALTAASSVTISEIDEIPLLSDFTAFDQQQQPSQDVQAIGGLLDTQEDMNGVESFDADFMLKGMQANRCSLPASFWSADDIDSMDPFRSEVQISNVDPSARKAKETIVSQGPYDQAWQDFKLQPTADDSTGRFGGFGFPSSSGRPQSLYAPTINTDNEDILSKLFPDYNLSSMRMSGVTTANIMSPATNDARVFLNNAGSGRRHSDPPSFNSASGTEVTSNFEWTDGTLPVGTSAFTDPFDLAHDFSNPDVSGTWPQ